MTPVLEAERITVGVGGKILLHEISLSIRPGEKVALVGPNGAGKSTLLRTLAGEINARSGAVRLKGRDIAAYAPRILAQHRAVLSQSISVAFPFTVAEIVGMGAGGGGGARVAALVHTALAEVDLLDFGDRIVTTLSTGEQQRAHLARVLVQLACGEAIGGPGVLMLDEPTSSLDLRHQLDVIEVARRCVSRGVTVVAILHDLNLATLFANRIVMLDGGRIAAEGSAAETITDATLGRVFRVQGAVGNIPAQGVPFVLPHGIHPSHQ